MAGKKITIYMVEGSPTGLLTAEIGNWTGKILVTPRSQLAEFGKRAEAKNTGVYCLIGADPEKQNREKIYIGEGDNVFNRLYEHDRDSRKDYWTKAFVVISKDENLTKSHIRFLESRLIEIANNVHRATVDNSTAPNISLPEADQDDMEYFLNQILMVIPVLGFTFLQSKADDIDIEDSGTIENPMFQFISKGVEAFAVEANGEFIVLKGSKAHKKIKPSCDGYIGLREQLIADKILIDDESKEFYIFSENVPFSSPSAAAAIVYAGNQNGRIAWKTKGTNKKYGEWKEEQLKED